MVKLKRLVNFLDKELDIASVDDSSFNGLQVEASDDIKKVGFAVDACMETFVKAKKEGCDLLVVHHGILWQNDIKANKITGINFSRLKFLLDNRIALYAAHLPLDRHPKYGNNARLFRIIGATFDPKDIFGGFGFVGSFSRPKKLKDIISLLNRKIGAKCQILHYGKDAVKTVAIVSGGAQYSAFEAIARDIDLFISGEIGHAILHPVKEAKINVIGAGHYATETVGVKALMPLLSKKFGVKTIFLDSPTGL